MKILILGHGRHGKDEVAALLQRLAGLTFTSSSWACAELLKPVLDVIDPPLTYTSDGRCGRTVQEHFDRRHNNRMLWKELISLYNAADPSALARRITEHADIYVGMRAMREFNASAHLFDHIIWVDASQRVDYVDPTLEIPFCKATMVLIDNNGTLEDLAARVASLGLRPDERP